MPPRLPPSHPVRLLPRCWAESCQIGRSNISTSTSSPSIRSQHSPVRPLRPVASLHTTSAARLAAPVTSQGHLSLPADYVPPTQPPSAKRPDIRKTQLLRTYTSLLRSTPLMLVFQHSNLTGPEWAAVRRELGLALNRVADQQKQQGIEWPDNLATNIRFQVLRTRIFDVAMRVVEFFDPAAVTANSNGKAVYAHDLSEAAYSAIKDAVAKGAADPERSVYGQLSPLLVGPLAVLTFPAVSPAHLAAALSVLAPNAPDYPPPPRKKNPGYYEPAMQNALPKLMLVGGRIEGKAFDMEGVRWVGSIEGGRAGLQAQLVAMLQSAGLGLTTALEGASKSLWLTMESRRTVLEEEGKQ